MQEHSAIGERILRTWTTTRTSRVVRHHHERIDGEGYPDGIAGLEIPLISRIIAVADAYNAMTSDRPYRDAMPSRVASLRLAQAAVRSSTHRSSSLSKRCSRRQARITGLPAEADFAAFARAAMETTQARSCADASSSGGVSRLTSASACGVERERVPRSDPQLVEDVMRMHLDRGLGNEQAFRDLPVG